MNWIIFNSQNIYRYIEFIDNHPNSGIWHYPCWLDFQINSKKAKEGLFFAIEKHDKIVLAGLLLIYSTSLKFNYFYIPAGFLYTEISDEIYDFFVANIKELAKEKKIVFTQIDSITPFFEKYNDLIKKNKNHKFNIKLPVPEWTNIIQLDTDEDQILEQMKPKGRYNIKLAIRKGVKIKTGNKDDIKFFYNILKSTAIRDGFNLNSEDYYHKMMEYIPNSVLLVAYIDDNILACGIFTYTKYQGLYYYGASSDKYRNLMATYLIQWEAIKIAIQKGCKYFDFMGIAKPDDPNDRLLGVTEFKLKFGGEIVKFNPSYRIIHNRIIYNVYNSIKNLKKSN